MKIQTRLLGGFLFISLLAALAGYWGLLQLKEIAKPLNKDIPLSIELLDRASTLDKLARYIQYLDEVLTQSVRNYALTQDIRWKQRYYAFKPELDQAIQQALDKSTDANRPLFKHVKAAKTALVEMESTAIGLLNSNNHSEAIDLLESERYRREKRNFDVRLQDYFLKHGIIEKQEMTVKLAAQHTQEILRDSIAITLLFVTAIIALSIIVGLIITQSIARPLRQLIRHTEKISRGDLSQQIDIVSNDEIGNLASSFNQMTAKLQKTTVSKDYVDNIIRSMTDSLIIVSPDGNIETVNAATSALLGYEEKELIGHPVSYIFAEEAFLDTKIAELIKKRAVTNIDVNYCTKDGKEVSMLLSGAAMKDPAGNLKAIVVVARDMRDSKLIAELQAITEQLCEEIAERKQTEEKLLQAQKMEAIGTLAGGIAHDFNNILCIILGYADMAKKDAPPGSKFTSDLDAVLNAGNRAKDLVKQILTFSRKTDTKKQLIRPHLIVKEAVKMLHSTLPTTIHIKEDIDQDCGTILANPTNVHQIALNLCTNALHAMANQKGTLSVSMHRRELSRENIPQEWDIDPGPFIILTVSDTGSGMDKDTMDRIFEPYYTTKEMGTGTGMGLALIHGIVQDCKGFIEVESTVGQGTTLSVCIPATEEPAVQPTVSDQGNGATATAGGNERILVVDDEPLLVKINQSRLESRGYQVTAVSDSREALEKFRSQPDSFDLLITDQTMPGLTGAELATAVREIKPSLLIIICTGHSDTVPEEKALSMGINKYVFKPIYGDELLDAVREVLDEK